MLASRLAMKRLAVAVSKKQSAAMGMAVRSVVTIEEAKKMHRNYNDIPNDILLTMANMGDQEAREERLIREIMAIDNVTW